MLSLLKLLSALIYSICNRFFNYKDRVYAYILHAEEEKE